MNNKVDYFKAIITIIIIIVIFVATYFIYENVLNKKNTSDINYLKDYSVNEYIPTYISDEQMAKIYLKDYLDKMFSDTETAYNKINSEYRIKKFSTVDTFVNYINNTNFSYNLKSFATKKTDKHIYFYIYDENNNFIIFKTSGVMQYQVYFDSETVEI